MRMPAIPVMHPAISSTTHMLRWMPRSSGLTPAEPMWIFTCWKWPDASQPAV